MNMRIVLWIVLALGVTSLVIGCVEWFRGRGRYLVLASVPNIALAIGMLLGDGHPVWRYTFLAIVFGSVTYMFITQRRKIPWRSPMLLFAAAAMVLIIVTELLTDVFSGTPRAIVRALVWAVGASTVLFIASIFWEANRMFRLYKASRARPS
jgi:hypothetical protein